VVLWSSLFFSVFFFFFLIKVVYFFIFFCDSSEFVFDVSDCFSYSSLLAVAMLEYI